LGQKTDDGFSPGDCMKVRNLFFLSQNFTSIVKRRWLVRFVSVFLVFGFQCCLTVGDDFSSEVTWIQKSQTTKKELETKIGPPFRVGYDTGLLTYTYAFYRYSVFRPTRTKDLTVRFNQDGTVHSYTFATSFDEEKDAVMRKSP
jgi:hypothetical protein